MASYLYSLAAVSQRLGRANAPCHNGLRPRLEAPGRRGGQGRRRMIELILERLDGKVKDSVEVSGRLTHEMVNMALQALKEAAQLEESP